MTQNEIGAKIARSEAAPGVAMNQEMMDLRVYKTRRNIKNTLLSLLEQKPLEDVTITELCGAAMINRKTFYRHYSAVNAVLADIENDLVEDFLRVMRDKDTSCLEAFKILDCIQEFVLKNKATLERITRLTPDMFCKGKLRDMLHHTLRISVKRLPYDFSAKETEYISLFMVNGTLALYTDWFKNGCTGDLDALTTTAKRLIAQGLRFYQ